MLNKYKSRAKFIQDKYNNWHLIMILIYIYLKKKFIKKSNL